MNSTERHSQIHKNANKYIIHGPFMKNLSESVIEPTHKRMKISKSRQLKKMREEISGDERLVQHRLNAKHVVLIIDTNIYKY